MNDERPEMTPQELDELASAYLDGEATAEEAALVESDPRAQALVEELRAVRDLVAAPVELPSGEVRDQMIAQALDHRAPVASLETARRRLRSIPPQARVILAAAAIVAAIAMVGVTVFEQVNDDDAGEQFADDSSAVVAMDDEPADTEEMSRQAPAAEAEISEAHDEAPASNRNEGFADLQQRILPEAHDEAPASSDSDDSAAAFSAEAPAEDMMDEEMAIELPEAPMDDGQASDEPSEDEAAPEPMMADKPDVVPTSGEIPLVFETAAELLTHVVNLVAQPFDEEIDGQEDTAAPVDPMSCPQPLGEGVALLIKFAAVVEGIEVEVSVYQANEEVLVSQTTPPPECTPIVSLTLLP